MSSKKFVDPTSKRLLVEDSEGNLIDRDGAQETVYRAVGGCFDFVTANGDLEGERAHYDREYSGGSLQGITIDSVSGMWFDDAYPWRSTLLQSMGELKGKRILLIGNGESSKEFYFHHKGASVVFTDLSIEAVTRKKEEFERSELSKNRSGDLEFHAVDALHLPFPEDYFDIIYGFAFVHHLDDLDPFFVEVRRCLKTGGICRFLDQAYAPLWEWAKRTVLQPVKLVSHWKHPRSPADLRADRRGGYKEEDMRVLMAKHGFSDLVFVRESLLYRLASRHLGKLVDYSPKAMRKFRPALGILAKIDAALARFNFFKKNQLMLTWGFTKSSAGTDAPGA